MKRMMYVMVAALMVLVGCNNEEIVESSAVKGSIKAALEQGNSSSRMAIGTSNALTWTSGDAFVMFSVDGTVNEIWKLKEGAGENSASFTGNVIEGDLKGAAYPLAYSPSFDGTTLSMKLPLERTYSANAACDLPMWATFSSINQPVNFYHLCALLKVGVNDIPQGYNTLIVEADKPLAGDFSVDPNSFAFLVADSDNESKVVKVSFDAVNSSADNDRVFYLPLPVENYGSLSVKLSNGNEEIVLNEWKNRNIQRGKVYWTSLTYKVSEATTTADVTAELKSLTTVSSTLQVTLANEIVDVAQPIEIPVVEGATANVELIFENVPVTTSESPITFTGAENSADIETDKISVSFPKDDSNPIYMVIDNPINTVTLEEGNFATVVSTTAAQTLVVEKNTVIGDLIVKGGNVIVYGEITGSITRHTENSDAVTKVVNVGGKLPETIGEGIKVYSSEVNGDQSWYIDNLNASELSIGTREELVGFMDLLYMGTTFEGKTVKLTNDIDMYACTYKTSGLAYNNQAFGFMGTFDGQGHAVKDLNIEYVYSAVNSKNVLVGLIPAASLATIKNVTVEGGKVYIPSCTDSNASIHAGALLGLVQGTVISNCHNVNCNVVTEVPGRAGGIVGYLRRINASGVTHYSYVMACSNSGKIEGDITSEKTMMLGGIAGGGWGTNSYVVACYNSGEVTCAYGSGSSYAAGIVSDHGGLNYMYGCFNDAKVSGAMYSGELIGQATYAGYYRYSCYTGEIFAGQDWTGEANRLELHQCSYAEAVSVLNAGIAAFNADETASVKCYYRYVKGNVPALEETGNFGENSDVTNGAWDAE
ncbi:MAG: hypothetical protein IJZ38_11670 [Bacteroides sp.]|nr:hypothetical protein [Bacteroides sp.]